MLKWVLTIVIVLLILAVATPLVSQRLGRFAPGRLPGDFRIPLRGRSYYIPFTSTVLFCALMWLVGKVI
jgi:hypothetical protein